MKKAIVIGGTSGIGEELVKVLSKNKYIVGIVGRREEKLIELQKKIPGKIYIKKIDISKTKDAITLLKDLIKEVNRREIRTGQDFERAMLRLDSGDIAALFVRRGSNSFFAAIKIP